MRIELTTKVNGHYQDVMSRFDRDLFEALAPPLATIKIIQFTGSKTGDIVHLKQSSPFSFEWISKIIDHGTTEDKAYFIDQGFWGNKN